MIKVNQVQTLPLVSLHHNPSNPKRPMGSAYLRGLRTSLSKFGFADVLVVADNHDGSYEILDGNTRLSELDSAGVQEIPCIVLDLDKDDRKEFVLAHDRHRKLFDEDAVMVQLKELANAGRDVKHLQAISAVDNLKQILEESNRATIRSPTTQPSQVAVQGSLILYGPAEDVDAIKQLLKRLRGKMAPLVKTKQLLEQAEQFHDLTDEQFLICFASAVARTTEA